MRIYHFRMLSAEAEAEAEAEEKEGDNAADNVDNNEEEDGSVADEEGADNYGGMGPSASTATVTNE